MKPIFVRGWKASDAQPMADWLARIADKNLIDGRIFEYPVTQTMCAEKEGRPLLYVPVQTCDVLESLAPNPEASFTEIAGALDKVVSTAVWEGRRRGHGELLWLCRDQQTCAFAERHGVEKVNIPLYRIRL